MLTFRGVNSSIACVQELRQFAAKAYRAMKLAREFDRKIAALYRGGKIYGGVFLGRGHEAVAACAATFLERGKDVYNPFIREQAGRCALGLSVLESARVYLNSPAGCMQAHDSNVHWGLPAEGVPAPVSSLGSMVSVVAGMVYARRAQGAADCVGVCHVGDGTTSVGALHEAANMVAVMKLPVVIVVTNNQFAYSTPNEQEFACKSLADRGRGYGMACHECDGTNFLQTLQTMQAAVAAARRGEGPQWVVATTLRLCGHGEHDDAAYIPQELKDAYADRDPLDVACRQMQEQGWLTPEQEEELAAACREEVQAAVNQAQADPAPNPAHEPLTATMWHSPVC